MVEDSTDSVWGVMDVYPQTKFPDIRRKSVLRSDAGTILIIPREGGSLVRLYIELASGTVAKEVTLEDLQAAARRIFNPYEMDFADTFWWSAYSVGQRLANHFSKDNRVFLTGDACHTHSPKAGQGMNVSLQDGYNIGWKLASILKGQAGLDLLKTYNIEREKVAADLIAFDRGWAKAFSSKAEKETNGTSEKFSDIFTQAGRYTAGLTATYEDSPITRAEWSNQALASNLKVGMRFPSAQVVRHCDAKAMQLVKALPADGRWRIIIFAGDIREDLPSSRLREVGMRFSQSRFPLMSLRSWQIISHQKMDPFGSSQRRIPILIVSSSQFSSYLESVCKSNRTKSQIISGLSQGNGECEVNTFTTLKTLY
jgi:phenol 2-monooxygenase